MRVRFSRLAGITCIVGAAVFGLLALLSASVSFVGAMTPVAFLGFGIAVLTRSYLIVGEDAVIVKALIGPAQETYGLGPADVVEFEGKRVFLVGRSGRHRLRGVTGWLASSRDWAAFRAWAERRNARSSSATSDDCRPRGGPHAA
jgi:hypothetical protein